jgi:uncharacterized protein YhaN
LIIKEVIARGFGTLCRQRFTFHRGLNIVYGPNEAGKSTLQLLIYALLYGLKKKHASTLIDEAEHYRPWGRPEPFGGSMLFQVGDREYSVERDFTDKGTARLHDAITGSDLEKKFQLDQRGELLFTQELLGLSPLAFKNITYIGQLASRCQSELAEELAGRLVNLSASGEEEISLRRGLAALGKAKEKIGTTRPSTKPLSQLLQRTQELSRQQEELEAQLAQLWQEQRQLVELEEELGRSQERKKALEAKQRAIEAYLLAERLEEIHELTQELKVARQELEELQDVDLPGETIDDATALQKHASWLEAELEKDQESLAFLEGKCSQLNSTIVTEERRLAAISSSLPSPPPEFYRSLQSKKDLLTQRRSQLEQQRVLAGDLPSGLPWPSLILSLAFGAFAFKWPLFFLPAGIMLVVFMILLFQREAHRRKIQAQLKDLAVRREALDREEAALQDSFEKLAKLLGAEPSAGILNWQRHCEELARQRGSLTECEAQLEQKENELKAQQEQLFELNEKIQGIWQEARAASWDEFWHQAKLSARRQKLEEKIERQQERLKYQLAGEEPEELAAHLAALEEPICGSAQELAELSGQLEKLTGEIGTLKIQRGNLEGRLDLQLESPAVLAASLRQAEEEFSELSLMRDALEYAEKTLESCTEELHRQFAPQLNRQVSQAFCALTLGKYKKVQVNENLQLSLQKPGGGLVEAERLSGGALDQLYFALRLGLSRLVGKEDVALPFLLDDTFVQYDRERAKEGWRCLRELARENQIIYFTCHREQLELAGAGVKVIDLTERKEAM